MSQIKITPALLADWRQKAEAAGGGEWKVYNASDGSIFIYEDIEGSHLAEMWSAKDADHIAAASPAVVLALVAEVERLRNRLDAIECPNCGHPPKFCMCDEQTSGNETNFVTKGEHNG
jgi:hypothetical protein